MSRGDSLPSDEAWPRLDCELAANEQDEEGFLALFCD